MSSVSASGGRRSGTVALAVILAVIAVLFAIAGVIYLTKTHKDQTELVYHGDDRA